MIGPGEGTWLRAFARSAAILAAADTRHRHELHGSPGQGKCRRAGPAPWARRGVRKDRTQELANVLLHAVQNVERSRAPQIAQSQVPGNPFRSALTSPT